MNKAPRNMPTNKVNAAITMLSAKFDIFKSNVSLCTHECYF
jgi:hypothetical protein